MKETLRHREAFELYYKQGKDRSLGKVAKVIKASEDTLKKWSVAFNWQDKILERDKEIASRLSEKNIEEEVNTRVLLNKASNESIELYRRMLKNKDSIDIETVKVLDILGRLWKELETQVETVSSQPDGVNSQVETVNSRIKWNTETKTTLYQIKYSIMQLEPDKQEEFQDILTDEMYKAIEGFEPEEVPELLSERQLITLRDFGNTEKRIHYGPFGCGKTYIEVMALGLYAMKYEPPKAKDSCIILSAKTSISVKSNLCNPLVSLFGDNFRYDASKKDGVSKDAVLIDHNIKLVGLNDSNSEARFRGVNAYLILGDELATWIEENFNKLLGRLRGPLPLGVEKHSFEGATNPDSPIHWIKKLIDTAKDIDFIKWTEHDTITSFAKNYYATLRARYKDNPAYLSRYVYGEWSAAEGLVYPIFNEKRHVLTPEQIANIDFIEYRMGIDFGLNNPTGILLSGRDRDGCWVHIKEHYLRKTTLTEIGEKVVETLLAYPVKTIYVDPSATALKDKLKELGIRNFKDADNSVKEGIQLVYDLLSQDKLFYSSECENLIAEKLTYCYKSDGSDEVVKSNDHLCDAERYLIKGERG